MAVYAPVPAYADRRRHPRTLVIILAGHIAVLAAVMTAKMDMPSPFDPTITKVKLVPEPQVPPPEPPPAQPRREPQKSRIDQVPSLAPVPQPRLPALDPAPLPLPGPGPSIGSGMEPRVEPLPTPVRTGPRFATPESRVKPPYPAQKLRMEEEAALRLRLTIDARGRVTAVEPVASADPAFLAAARRHIIANWRYQPATEDGKAVASSTVVTLRFELD